MAQTESYKIQIVLEGQDKASQSLASVNQQLGKMDDSVNTTKSAWQKFDINAFIGATAAVAGIGAIVVQMNELGTAANAAQRTFNQVSGGADEAAASLARMRSLTGGVIDDMTLMKGASSLLVTGIADTNQQAEELVNLGARLSSVMGVDAAEGIQNLNSALLNNSFMRLDTLGISAAAVRERVNELKEAGMDMSEAFSQAVLEIGSKTLEDLGDAANVAETSVAKLQTRFANMAQDLGQWVNVQLETMATTLDQIITLGDIALGGTGGIPALEEQKQQYNDLMALADEYLKRREEVFTSEGYSITDSGLSTQEAYTFQQNNASMFPDISSGSYFQDAFNSDNVEAINDARVALTLLRPEWAALTDEQLKMYALDIDNQFRAVADAQEGLAVNTQAAAQAQEAQNEALAQGNELASLEERSAMIERSSQQLNELRAQSEALNDSFATGTLGTGFFDPAALADVQAHAEAVTAEYEKIKALAENDELSLVTPEDLERAKEIAEQANAVADSAEKNAAAWEKASLAMIAGATGGGRQNEFNQMVLANIQDPELRKQAEAQFNLASGVETANTRVLDYGSQLVSTVTEEQGIAAGQRAGEDFVKAFEDGIKAGLEGEDLKNYVEEQVGYAIVPDSSGGGKSVTVQAGDTLSGISAQTGISLDELIAANGGSTLIQPGQVITVGDGSSLIALGKSPEEAVTDTVDNLFTNLMNKIVPPTPTSTGDTSMTPSSDYTYYDPATGQYTYSNDPAVSGQVTNDARLISEEESAAVSQVQVDMEAAENSFSNIAQTDLTEVVDPIIEDTTLANEELDEAQNSIAALAAQEWKIRMPVELVFDQTTAEMLSRNTTFVEAIKLVAPAIGLTPSGG